MVGPREVSQLLRDHTIAVWEPAGYMPETLSSLITKPVCSLDLKSRASTQKLCLANGSSKLALAKALSVRGSSSPFLKCIELILSSG